MASKKYYECDTAGNGSCWFCGTETNFIYDDENDEIFCCLKCFRIKIPNFKRKSKIFKKLCVKTGKVGLLLLGTNVQSGLNKKRTQTGEISCRATLEVKNE